MDSTDGSAYTQPTLGTLRVGVNIGPALKVAIKKLDGLPENGSIRNLSFVTGWALTIVVKLYEIKKPA